MEKINLTEEIKKRSSFIEHVLLNTMIGHLKLNKKNDVEFDKIFKIERDEKGDIVLDVKLTINGEECSVQPFFDRLERSYEWATEKLAREIAGDMLHELFRNIDNHFREMKEGVKNKFPDLFYKEE